MLFSKPKRVVKRILIVEDEPLVAFDMETMLADEGYEVVHTVDTFAAAIETLDKEQVDLILCDVRLHGDKTGIHLAKEACKRGIPVLFATGHVPPDARQAGDRLPDQAVQYADAEGGAGKRQPASCRANGPSRPRGWKSTRAFRPTERARLRPGRGIRRFRFPACRA